MKPANEITYINAAIKGDENAFAQLIQAHQCTIAGIVYAITKTQEAVDDIVQDTFLVAWKQLDQLKAKEKFTPWLCTIARNLAKNWIRSEVYRRTLAKAYSESINKTSTSGYVPLMQSENFSRLRTMFETISPSLQETMILFYFEELSIKEIAHILEISPSNTKKRLERGRTQLRDRFEQEWKDQIEKEAPANQKFTGKVIARLTIGPAMSLSAYLSTGSLAAVPASLAYAPATKGILTLTTTKVITSIAIVTGCALGANHYWQPEENTIITQIEEGISSTIDKQHETPTSTPIDNSPTTLTKIPANIPIKPKDSLRDEQIALKKAKRRLKIDNQVTISGTVLDQNGDPMTDFLSDLTLAFAPTLDKTSPTDRDTTQKKAIGDPKKQHKLWLDHDGKFSFTVDYTQDTVGIIIAKDKTTQSQGSTKFYIQDNKDKTNLSIELQKGLPFHGRILSQNNTPIPYAYINTRAFISNGNAHSGSLAHAFANSNGEFTVYINSALNTVNGKAAFRIFSPQGEAMFQDIPVGSPERTDLKLPIYTSLSGTILNQDGTPAKGIWLTLDSKNTMYAEDPQYSVESGVAGIYGTTTDHQGRYTIPDMTPNLSYFVTLRLPSEQGGTTLSPRIKLDTPRPGESQNWDYTIKEGIKITGTVRGAPSGDLLRGIVISLKNDSTIKTTSDKNGEFELVGAITPGKNILAPYNNNQLEALGPDVHAQEIYLDYGDQKVFDLNIPDPSTLYFQVVDNFYTPIRDCVITPLIQKGRNQSSLRPIGRSGQTGIFRWTKMIANVNMSFKFSKDNYLPAESKEYLAEPGTIFPQETIVLYPKASAEGYAFNPDGSPIVGIKLLGEAYYGDNYIHQFHTSSTDKNGYFTITKDLPATTAEIVLHSITHFDDTQNFYTTWESSPIKFRSNRTIDIGDIHFPETSYNTENKE